MKRIAADGNGRFWPQGDGRQDDVIISATDPKRTFSQVAIDWRTEWRLRP
jgi:hypothetical protein